MDAPKTETILALARRAPVIPVLTIDDARRGIPLARTLVDAGLPVIEVTLRTSAALEAIAAIGKAVPEAFIGAGTILDPRQIPEVAEAGAKFIVTPGTPPKLAEALAAATLPAMPGCSTIAEAMLLATLGFEVLKFFPAAASGGPAWLKACAGPLPGLKFCPTGGIDANTAPDYLSLPNVLCVGGSWMVPGQALAAGDFDVVGELARKAAALGRSGS